MFAASNSGSLPVNISPEASSVNVQPVFLSQPAGSVDAPPNNSNSEMQYGDGFYVQVEVQGKSGVGAASGNLTIQLDDLAPFGPFPLTASGTGFIEVDGLNYSGYNDIAKTGLARLSSTGILPGNHTVKVTYSGDNSFKPAESTPLALKVTKDSSRAAVSALQNFYTEGTPIDFTLQVLPFFTSLGLKGLEQPTGTVQIYECKNSDCTNSVKIGGPIELATNNAGEGTGLSVSQATYRGTFSVGTHALRLGYSGDSNYMPESPAGGGSLRISFLVTVNPPSGMVPNIQLKQSTGTVTVGESESYIASVKPAQAGKPIPTGTVSLFDQFANSFGTIPLINGNASFVVPMVFAGQEQIFVEYSGDANYTPLDSVVLETTTVKPAESTITLNAAKKGITTTLTATVIGEPLNPAVISPFQENGQVEFFDSVNGQAPTVLGNGPVVLVTANGGSSPISLLSVIHSGRYKRHHG